MSATQPANQYDAIVIGAGHNGLVTAAYLEKAGLRTIVLEANEQTGGAAATREFAPGFRVSPVAHLLHALHPKVVSDLRLNRYGLRASLRRVGTSALLADGARVDITQDRAATAVSIAHVSPADGAAFAPVMARLTRLASALGGFLMKTPPSPMLPANDLATKISLGAFALQLRLMGRRDMLELTRILTMNVADLATDFFESDAIRGLLAFDATLGVYLGPRSPNTVFNLLYRLASFGRHGMGAFHLPMGGMGSLAEALTRSAKAAGVEIRSGTRVDHLLIENDSASGVVLANGDEIRAPIVASSADPQATLLKLVQPGNLDAQFLKRIRHLRMNGCVAKMHLALDGLPESWAKSAGRMVVAPSIDHVERAFDCAKYGRVADRPALEIVTPSLSDPSLAPQGKHVASILFQYAPYKLRTTTNEEARRQIGERALALLAGHAPDLAGRVLAQEVLTPQDIESQFGMSGGQWHHGEVTLDQMFFLRPAAQFQRYRMPIPGLWLCGAGAHPGGNLSGAPGANAAREILKDRRRQRQGAPRRAAS